MNGFTRFLLVVFGLAFSVVFSILVMIHGWGIEPKSYGWIIGIGVVSQIFAQLILATAQKRDK